MSNSLAHAQCYKGFLKVPFLVECNTTSDDVLLAFCGLLARSINGCPNELLDALLDRYFVKAECREIF